MRNGVKASINTIAVQTLEKVGVTAAYQFATENLGLSLAPEDMNVSPLGLGGLTASARWRWRRPMLLSPTAVCTMSPRPT